MTSCSSTDLLAAWTELTSSPSFLQTILAGGLESTRQVRVAVSTESVMEVARDRWTLGWSEIDHNN